MEKSFDVVALGELLIDFTPAGYSTSNMRLFEQNAGGAPANVLCALSNLGMNTAFIGKVGKDMHGDFLCKTLTDKKVDTIGLIRDEDVFTTLAFVELSQTGERSFSFARKPGADTCLRTDELNIDVLKSCKVFHFGSVSLSSEPCRAATISAIDIAKQAGAIISYDPNYREPLWAGQADAQYQIRKVLDKVDIIKISEDEMELLTGQKTLEEAADFLLSFGISCVVITLGANGAYAKANNIRVQVSAPASEVVDSTGAGDAFWGSFLYGVLDKKLNLEIFTEAELTENIKFSNTVASLCVRKHGAIPSFPAKEEVFNFLNV